MTKKIVPPEASYTITTCLECKHRDEDDQYGYNDCEHPFIQGKRINRLDVFPKWCPLEDAKDDT